MDPSVSPVFEVVTIKPSKPDEANKYLRFGRRFQAVNYNLSDLIVFSYGAHPKQVIAAPAWAETDKFDIDGEPEGAGLPNLAQWKIMLQKLLADRCNLAFHREQRELPVYILSAVQGGPRLAKSQGDPNGRPGLGFRGKPGDLSAYNATIGDLVNFITRNVPLDRPIIDSTGISGRYDFTLEWTPEDSQSGSAVGSRTSPAVDSGASPSLYTALREQLGLRLTAAKAPVDVLIIDHVEKPSAN